MLYSLCFLNDKNLRKNFKPAKEITSKVEWKRFVSQAQTHLSHSWTANKCRKHVVQSRVWAEFWQSVCRRRNRTHIRALSDTLSVWRGTIENSARNIHDVSWTSRSNHTQYRARYYMISNVFEFTKHKQKGIRLAQTTKHISECMNALLVHSERCTKHTVQNHTICAVETANANAELDWERVKEKAEKSPLLFATTYSVIFGGLNCALHSIVPLTLKQRQKAWGKQYRVVHQSSSKQNYFIWTCCYI